MRKNIPHNNVKHDYERVLREFVTQLKNKLGDCLVLVYLTGSYARGDATDRSDLDVFCIFNTIDQKVLETVGFCARNTSVPFEELEINTQSMSVQEYLSNTFDNWSEHALTELTGVLLYGKELVQVEDIKDKISDVYKKELVEVLMSIRHYICVDKPKEALTHERIKTYVLKPLMFALRQERFCKTGVYPLSIRDLRDSYDDENVVLVDYFLDKEKFEADIRLNHKSVLMELHQLVQQLIEER